MNPRPGHGEPAEPADAGVEAIEVPTHPFFIATLFQPQVGSLAGQPLHRLIAAFLEAARAHRGAAVA